jgi:nitrite reductase/ring-hydroxylating ferredoxin subunit
MATTRRVFLEVVGVGAAGVTVNAACVGFVEDGGLPRADGLGGARTQTGSGGAPGAGGATGTGGTGVDGAGGSGSGAGGDVGTGAGGRTGGMADAGAPRDTGSGTPRDSGIDTRDSGTAPRDAGPILQPGDLAAGNVSGLAVGALNAIPNSTVAIGRDAMGLYALTLVCTHQGCTAAPAGATGARQVNCPCHGSQFDRNGAVIRGPATRPLVHFSVTIDASGNIVVHSNTQVAATVRAVP